MLRRGQIDNRLGSLLSKRVSIYRYVTSSQKNELGQYPKEESLLCECWAGIIPQTGSLLSGRTADTALSKTTHKIVIRYRDDITPDCWIVYNNQRYNVIYALDPYSNHERLEVFCEVLI